mmetsp:Transcript_48392/g.90666  ORF Transcript_48392/g.90666 Transcript_48392/m.90666 type:complete len:196 (+) Transcript_48392:78-665(+)
MACRCLWVLLCAWTPLAVAEDFTQVFKVCLDNCHAEEIMCMNEQLAAMPIRRSGAGCAGTAGSCNIGCYAQATQRGAWNRTLCQSFCEIDFYGCLGMEAASIGVEKSSGGCYGIWNSCVNVCPSALLPFEKAASPSGEGLAPFLETALAHHQALLANRTNASQASKASTDAARPVKVNGTAPFASKSIEAVNLYP